MNAILRFCFLLSFILTSNVWAADSAPSKNEQVAAECERLLETIPLHKRLVVKAMIDEFKSLTPDFEVTPAGIKQIQTYLDQNLVEASLAQDSAARLKQKLVTGTELLPADWDQQSPEEIEIYKQGMEWFTMALNFYLKPFAGTGFYTNESGDDTFISFGILYRQPTYMNSFSGLIIEADQSGQLPPQYLRAVKTILEERRAANMIRPASKTKRVHKNRTKPHTRR